MITFAKSWIHRSRLSGCVSRHASQKRSEAEKPWVTGVYALIFTFLVTVIARRCTRNLEGHRCVAVKPEPPLTPQPRSTSFAGVEGIANCTFIFAFTDNGALLGAFGRSFKPEDIRGFARCEAVVDLLGIFYGILPLGIEEAQLLKNFMDSWRLHVSPIVGSYRLKAILKARLTLSSSRVLLSNTRPTVLTTKLYFLIQQLSQNATSPKTEC